jgi:hypothetical protein
VLCSGFHRRRGLKAFFIAFLQQIAVSTTGEQEVSNGF